MTAAATPSLPRMGVSFGLALACLAWLGPPGARADDPAPEDGLFITVNHPITSGVMNRVKETTEWARRRTDRRIRKVVYDFTPGSHPCGSKDYGPCYDLAKYLLGVQ